MDGRLLVHVECVQDLIDIDAQFVKPLFARRLFAQLADWKGTVSREMLLPLFRSRFELRFYQFVAFLAHSTHACMDL